MRSALAAKVFAFIDAFHTAFLIATDLKQTHGEDFDPFMFTDSLQLFDALTEGRRTDERMLMNDILAAHQSYKRYEVAEAGYICGVDNPADGLTNVKSNGIMNEVFEAGVIVGQRIHPCCSQCKRTNVPQARTLRKHSRFPERHYCSLGRLSQPVCISPL